MKQNELSPHSVTDDMFKSREVTPIVRGLPPCEDSQPIPWVEFVKAVQLAHKGSPNLTATLEGLKSTGQDELLCFTGNIEYSSVQTGNITKYFLKYEHMNIDYNTHIVRDL